MSSLPSSSTSNPSQIIPNFARGLISLFLLWPSLRLAVDNAWGGPPPESSDKRTWMISVLVDQFEEGLESSLAAAGESPVDQDDIAEMLHGMMVDEFETELEDGSEDKIAKDVIKLWSQVVRGETTMVEELDKLAEASKGRKVVAKGQEADEREVEGDWDNEDESEDEDEAGEGGGNEDAMDVDEPAPKLVERKEKIVDDDGFELVQGKGKGRKGR